MLKFWNKNLNFWEKSFILRGNAKTPKFYFIDHFIKDWRNSNVTKSSDQNRKCTCYYLRYVYKNNSESSIHFLSAGKFGKNNCILLHRERPSKTALGQKMHSMHLNQCFNNSNYPLKTIFLYVTDSLNRQSGGLNASSHDFLTWTRSTRSSI